MDFCQPPLSLTHVFFSPSIIPYCHYAASNYGELSKKKKNPNPLTSIIFQMGQAPRVGVLPSGSPRGIPRRVVMSRNSPRSERDGARNTRI